MRLREMTYPRAASDAVAPWDAEVRARAGLVADRLRAGEPVDDRAFDQIYPLVPRLISRTYWSPILVARRAAAALVTLPQARILDIGSGVGKFCIVGALATDGVFVGVEHRSRFVSIARETAEALGATNATFHHGRFHEIDPTAFDGVYLYNPFEENLWGGDTGASDVELSLRRFREDVRCTERLLARLRPGVRVVTYHGFGGRFPNTYERLSHESLESGALEVWTRRE